MTSITDKVNKKELYAELQAAIQEDKMYWVRNDAKLRAVQTSKCYEEFKDIVAAAYLQPLTKRDKEKSHKSWKTSRDEN